MRSITINSPFKLAYLIISLQLVGQMAFSQEYEAKVEMVAPLKLSYFLYQLKGKVRTSGTAKEIGFCISTHHLPTVEDKKIICRKANDSSFSVIIGPTQLNKGKEYFIRPFALLANKVEYGEEQLLSTINQKFEIGEKVFGGKIAYIFEPQDFLYVKGEIHGLIVAEEDLSNTYSWNPTVETNNQKSAIPFSLKLEDRLGFGKINTQTITRDLRAQIQALSMINQVKSITSAAAEICSTMKMNSYNDWFLPSLNEMEIVWFHQTSELQLNSKTVYWTSTSFTPNKAVAFAFKETPLIKEVKQELKFAIRPMRYF